MDLTKKSMRTRKQVRAKRKRTEAAVIKAVRAACVERDGVCLVMTRVGVFGECGGVSEWAHLSGHRRSQTRGMAPGLRHHTRFTAMLCTRHHREEEANARQVVYLTEDDADGPVTWVRI